MLALHINVEASIRRFSRDLDGIARDQLPFATALALTMTAKDAQKEVRASLSERFTLRSGWVAKGIQIVPANKRNLTAVVGSRDWFMADQETGGTRGPGQPHRQAVPTRALRVTKTTRITRAKWPGRLLNKKLKKRAYFVNKIAKGPRAGTFAVMRREGRERYPLQVLYLLREETKIKPRFGFEATVTAVVRRRLAKNFGHAFGRALATRRG